MCYFNPIKYLIEIIFVLCYNQNCLMYILSYNIIMENFLDNLLKQTNLSIDQIIFAINHIDGCSESITRDTIYRWKKKKFSLSMNKKYKGVICFCLYFKLESEEIFHFLNYLNIYDNKQVNTIIEEIEHLKKNSTFYFNGSDSLEIVEFSKMIIDNDLINTTSITVEDNKTKQILFYKSPSLKIIHDKYIRSIFINDLSLGGSNATLEHIALKHIKFTLNDDQIDNILSNEKYLGFNFYKANSLINIDLKQFCLLNHIDLVLAHIKKDTNYKQCPINIFLECIKKKLSLGKKRKIFEALKTLENYIITNACTDIILKKLLYVLQLILLDIHTDLLIKIYIIESLGYFYHKEFIRNNVWDIAKNFFKQEIKDSHLIWAFLVTLKLNEKNNYSYSDKALINRIKNIYISNNFDIKALEPLFKNIEESMTNKAPTLSV